MGRFEHEVEQATNGMGAPIPFPVIGDRKKELLAIVNNGRSLALRGSAFAGRHLPHAGMERAEEYFGFAIREAICCVTW